MPAPPAKAGVTLRYAEAMRHYVWHVRPYNKRPSDWDPVTRSYPADPDGCCRHKATWLQKHLGGTVLYGHRTDKVNPEMHAVLWINICGFDFMLDKDGIWPGRSAPFACDGRHKAYRR